MMMNYNCYITEKNSCSQSQTYDNEYDNRNVVVCLKLECFTVLKSWL